MSSDRNDQEPSMEEILSSIRRIIADDEDEAPPAKKAAPAPEPAKAKQPQAKAPPPPPEPEPEEEDDDVLDLTEVVERGKQPAADEDLFDAEADEIELEPEDDFEAAFEPEPEPEPRPAPRPMPKPKRMAPERPMIDEDSLVSQAAATASTGAFAKLAKAASGHEATPLKGGDKTVETFLTELLKPMLKDWLDTNLEGVVERVVEQEVKKLARRAELM